MDLFVRALIEAAKWANWILEVGETPVIRTVEADETGGYKLPPREIGGKYFVWDSTIPHEGGKAATLVGHEVSKSMVEAAKSMSLRSRKESVEHPGGICS